MSSAFSCAVLSVSGSIHIHVIVAIDLLFTPALLFSANLQKRFRVVVVTSYIVSSQIKLVSPLHQTRSDTDLS